MGIRLMLGPISQSKPRRISLSRNRNSFIADLRGGLGNQLSTVTTAVYLSKLLGKKPIFTLTGSNSKRLDSIAVLGIEVVGRSNKDRALITRALHKLLRKLRSISGWDSSAPILGLRRRFFGDLFVWGESSRIGGDQLARTKVNRVVGFLDGCDYFEKLDRPIRDFFDFRGVSHSRSQSSLTALVEQEASIAVHVRRGDYRTIPGALLPAVHYGDSLRFLEEIGLASRNKSQLVVFSDEPDGVGHEFRQAFSEWSVIFVRQADGGSAAEDLFLMSRFPILLAANSTFSWWAAHLSPKRPVVVPPPPQVPLNPWKSCRHVKLLSPFKAL